MMTLLTAYLTIYLYMVVSFLLAIALDIEIYVEDDNET